MEWSTTTIIDKFLILTKVSYPDSHRTENKLVIRLSQLLDFEEYGSLTKIRMRYETDGTTTDYRIKESVDDLIRLVGDVDGKKEKEKKD